MKITGKLTLTSKLFENDQMAPGAYTYLMYFTYSWYLADSERDKKIWSDAIQDIRNTGYKRTGSKYWDDLISGMPHRPNNGTVTEYEHYYRLFLNIEYQWDEFEKLNNRLPLNMKWHELEFPLDIYHQHDAESLWSNDKYISACGHFEVMYTKSNILLNQYNSPLDMGTYNYYSPNTQAGLHKTYDVYPFDNTLFTSVIVIISGYGNTHENRGIIQKFKELFNV